MCLLSTSKLCHQTFEQLCRKGNYYHNIEVLQKGEGEIVTYRQPSKHANAEDYLPCICYGFSIKDELWKHEKWCCKTVVESEVKSQKKEDGLCHCCLLPQNSKDIPQIQVLESAEEQLSSIGELFELMLGSTKPNRQFDIQEGGK
uniref:Uncharacterized protein n=1 Tax=Monopterus albus TaxID=43700 RepID=A0A3Q3JEZ2_MONAL